MKPVQVEFSLPPDLNPEAVGRFICEGLDGIGYYLGGNIHHPTTTADQLVLVATDPVSLSRASYRWGQLEQRLADGDVNAWDAVGLSDDVPTGFDSFFIEMLVEDAMRPMEGGKPL